MAKLDWEKAAREERVREKGAERASVTRFRAVAPSDWDVERLWQIGFSGARPATKTELQRLLSEWHPHWARITGADISELRRLPLEKRQRSVSQLLVSLEQAYREELKKIKDRALTGKKQKKGKQKIIARTTRKYECLRSRLSEIA
jgi:hypothetical protein